MTMQRYLVVIEKGENSYGAYAPDVAGCIAVGKSVEEALHLIQEALELHFEGMVEEGEVIPSPAHIEAHFVEVDVPATIPARS
jgi:predicted RNase H-like HicB family nuclease